MAFQETPILLSVFLLFVLFHWSHTGEYQFF
jgi:hypothetical protein